MIVHNHGNYSHAYAAMRGKYGVPERNGLLTIAADSHFIECNFSQALPHTPVFDLVAGVRLVLEECNLVNVSVPDGAEVIGGNLAHIVTIQAGDALLGEKAYTNLLHECAACACARQEMQECLNGTKAWIRDAKGRVLHHEMKERFRLRRLGARAPADLTKHRAENDAVVTRWSRTLDAAAETRLGRR